MTLIVGADTMEFTTQELELIKQIVETKRGLASYNDVWAVLDSIVKKCDQGVQ